MGSAAEPFLLSYVRFHPAEIAQRFALSRIAVEMEKRGATAIEEELQENGDIVIKMRRWD